MSSKHLATGDPLPPLKDGTIRLYSMRYCPYAQRSRLALLAKGLEFETVNCNLKTKPDWLFEKNPNGLVPVLEHDGKIVYDSLLINDYLDEVFPGKRQLHPKDPYQKVLDRMTLANFMSKASSIRNYYKSKGEDKESLFIITTALERLEHDLKKKGSTYFAGAEPGMVDYNLWPFLEILKNLEISYNENYLNEKIPFLNGYIRDMMTDEAVKSTYISPEIYMRYLNSMLSGNSQYDGLEL